jgi:hypothetical protein
MPKVDDDNTPQKDDAHGLVYVADREKTPRVEPFFTGFLPPTPRDRQAQTDILHTHTHTHTHTRTNHRARARAPRRPARPPPQQQILGPTTKKQANRSDRC